MLRAGFAFVLAAALAGAAAAASLVAGPMAGYRDARSVVLWFMADGAAAARVEYWPEGRPGEVVRGDTVRLSAAADHAAQLTLTGLAPGTTYRYRVLLDGRVAKGAEPGLFRTESLWQWRNHSFIAAQGHVVPDVKVAFGSCSYFNDPPNDRSPRPNGPYGGGEGIFERIADYAPDLMLWLGDNTYLREADVGHAAGIAARYRHDRSQPALQRLLRTGHHLAIWDDHDFGPNDANGSFTYKEAALETFRRYWPNGSGGQPGAPGIFRVVSHYDVDFFLLDGRFHRDADGARAMDDKTMLGAGQLRWLKNALLASTATFRVIVSGSQMLKTVPPRIEGWSHFARERQGFLDWLAENRVPGVVFLSGDRHHTVLTRLPREGQYPLHELTCSPLTAGVHGPARGEEMGDTDPATLVTQRNFCGLEASGPWSERRLALRVFDATGRELWRRDFGARELR